MNQFDTKDRALSTKMDKQQHDKKEVVAATAASKAKLSATQAEAEVRTNCGVLLYCVKQTALSVQPLMPELLLGSIFGVVKVFSSYRCLAVVSSPPPPSMTQLLDPQESVAYSL